MLATDRQAKLNPILNKLAGQVPGVKEVQQDDFNSDCVVVFIRLDDCNSRAGSFSGKRPLRFAVPLRRIKAAIRESLGLEVGFEFASWPELRYVSNGGEKVKDGYSQDYISLNIFI